MNVLHAANTKKRVGCGQMSGLDGGRLDSQMLIPMRKFERSERRCFLGLWVHRSQCDRGAKTFRASVLYTQLGRSALFSIGRSYHGVIWLFPSLLLTVL